MKKVSSNELVTFVYSEITSGAISQRKIFEKICTRVKTPETLDEIFKELNLHHLKTMKTGLLEKCNRAEVSELAKSYRDKKRAGKKPNEKEDQAYTWESISNSIRDQKRRIKISLGFTAKDNSGRKRKSETKSKGGTKLTKGNSVDIASIEIVLEAMRDNKKLIEQLNENPDLVALFKEVSSQVK